MPTVTEGPPLAAARPVVWRISDRRTFEELRHHGRRARRGPLVLTWLPAQPGDPSPARAGFAIPRTAGTAVVRNRVRRRLRAALRELAGTEQLPPGAYLLGGGAELARLPWPELVALVAAAIAEVRA